MSDLLGETPKPARLDELIAWLALKTGNTLAANKRVVGMWIKGHGVERVMDVYALAKSAGPISPVGYMGKILAGGRPELGAGSPLRAGNPIDEAPPRPRAVAEPPSWRVTKSIAAVRDRLVSEWEARDAEILAELGPEARWHVGHWAYNQAWVLAQFELMDRSARRLEVPAKEIEAAKARAASNGLAPRLPQIKPPAYQPQDGHPDADKNDRGER